MTLSLFNSHSLISTNSHYFSFVNGYKKQIEASKNDIATQPQLQFHLYPNFQSNNSVTCSVKINWL